MPGKHSVRNDTLCPVHGAPVLALLLLATCAYADTRVNDFPTLARVEYVQECVNRTGGDPTHIYQCSCVVDRIAQAMSYDEFVEASTFARYSTLPGEAGGIFRDTEEGKKKAKQFKTVEADAFRACNLKLPGAS